MLKTPDSLNRLSNSVLANIEYRVANLLLSASPVLLPCVGGKANNIEEWAFCCNERITVESKHCASIDERISVESKHCARATVLA